MLENKKPPQIVGAPGLTWRPRKVGWECRWQARTDLIARGYLPKTVRLFSGAEITPVVEKFIQDRANALQEEMLVWGRGGIVSIGPFDGTLTSLMESYQTDRDSTYGKLRYRTRAHYDTLMRMLTKSHGSERIEEIKARHVLRWHEEWSEGGKVSMAHTLVGMLRIVLNFGATILEDEHCERVAGVLHRMRFKMGRPRNERLTADQANAIRAAAHAAGLHSIALAQAFQFECMLRQKDVIGEWVPISEPGMSSVTAGNEKWARGIHWGEIERPSLIIRHITSKRQKLIEVALSGAPMVMEEFALLGDLPSSGPMIVSEVNNLPWAAPEFRRQWRKLATACGIPKTIRNMDSRAGAITEALMSGAPMDSVRKSATHSNASMTQRYSRGDAEASVEVAQFRAEYRNKKGT